MMNIKGMQGNEEVASLRATVVFILIASRIPPGRLSENCKQMCLISNFSTYAADFLFSLFF